MKQLANVKSASRKKIVYNETLAKCPTRSLSGLQAPLLNFKPPFGISSMVFNSGAGSPMHRPKPGQTSVYAGRVSRSNFGRPLNAWPPLYQLEIPAPRAASGR